MRQWPSPLQRIEAPPPTEFGRELSELVVGGDNGGSSSEGRVLGESWELRERTTPILTRPTGSKCLFGAQRMLLKAAPAAAAAAASDHRHHHQFKELPSSRQARNGSSQMQPVQHSKRGDERLTNWRRLITIGLVAMLSSAGGRGVSCESGVARPRHNDDYYKASFMASNSVHKNQDFIDAAADEPAAKRGNTIREGDSSVELLGGVLAIPSRGTETTTTTTTSTKGLIGIGDIGGGGGRISPALEDEYERLQRSAAASDKATAAIDNKNNDNNNDGISGQRQDKRNDRGRRMIRKRSLKLVSYTNSGGSISDSSSETDNDGDGSATTTTNSPPDPPKCRIESNSYLDFEDYKLFTCANCYNNLPLKVFKRKLHYDKSIRIFLYDDLASEFISPVNTERVNRTFSDDERGYFKWSECCREAVECCRRNVASLPKPKPSSLGASGGLVYLDSTDKCHATWDGATCFGDAEPGTIREEPCQDHIYSLGQPMKCRTSVKKQCFANGSWYIRNDHEWSDYSGCAPMTPVNTRMMISTLYYIFATIFVVPALLVTQRLPSRNRNKRLKIQSNIMFWLIIYSSVIAAHKVGLLYDDFDKYDQPPMPPTSEGPLVGSKPPPADSIEQIKSYTYANSSQPQPTVITVTTPTTTPSSLLAAEGSRSRRRAHPSAAAAPADHPPLLPVGAGSYRTAAAAARAFDTWADEKGAKFQYVHPRPAKSITTDVTTNRDSSNSQHHGTDGPTTTTTANTIERDKDEHHHHHHRGRRREDGGDGGQLEAPSVARASKRAYSSLPASGNQPSGNGNGRPSAEEVASHHRDASGDPLATTTTGATSRPSAQTIAALNSATTTAADHTSSDLRVHDDADARERRHRQQRQTTHLPSSIQNVMPMRNSTTDSSSSNSSSSEPTNVSGKSFLSGIICWTLALGMIFSRQFSYAWMFAGAIYLCLVLHFAPRGPPIAFVKWLMILTNAFPATLCVTYTLVRSYYDASPLKLIVKSVYLYLAEDSAPSEQYWNENLVCWIENSQYRHIEQIAELPNLVLIILNTGLFVVTLIIMCRITGPDSTRPTLSLYDYFKAAGTLVTLYGVHYFSTLVVTPPADSCFGSLVVYHVSLLIDGGQGIAIAYVFCYRTQEGKEVMSKWLKDLKEDKFSWCCGGGGGGGGGGSSSRSQGQTRERDLLRISARSGVHSNTANDITRDRGETVTEHINCNDISSNNLL